MKLRLPRTLFRALVACFASMMSLSLASASPTAASAPLLLPDIEQTDSMLCWAASAADMLAMQTGEDAATIYRSITAASGNNAGYVESALSWYREGAEGALDARAFDGSHSITRSGFASAAELAATLEEALRRARAASLSFHACGNGPSMGHAVTVYACTFEDGRLIISYVDSADGVAGLRRAEVLEQDGRLLLAGTDLALDSLTYLGDGADDTPAAPVGGIMHASPYLQEYTDMAENRGVYRFAYSPSVITYRNGEPDYSLSVTPDYSSVADMGCYTLLHNGSNQMTVEHNGIMNGSTYTGRYVGEYAQKYSVAGIRYNKTFTFGTNNPYVPTHDDYRIERMTRLVTDTDAAAYSTDEQLLSNLEGVTIYRVGAGISGYYDTSGNFHRLAGEWGSGLTAGITSLMEQIFYHEDTGIIGIQQRPSGFVQTTPENPLPSAGLQGDSGSPLFIYNEETQRMEIVASLANGDIGQVWQAYYSPRATTAVDEYCTTTIATATDFNADAAEATTLYLSGAKVSADDELIQDGEAATHLRKGTVTLNGETIATYNGVALEEFSQGTWKKLDADSLTWYTYSDNDYLNVVSDKATDANTFGTDDLFYTSNLHFKANSANGSETAHRRIELTEHVDLGIGHVQFSLGEGVTSATYDLGQSSSDKFLSSAGFVVDKGVTLNNYFTYEKGRELRRVGEGVMNMVGTGNNDVLLNIGGSGLTYLNRTDGYAAYSVLVNNKAVLKLADAGQVHNNVTLGANGGVLDFNGNAYRWTSGGARAEGSDGTSYFGLTVYGGLNRVETSTLANYAAGTTSTITIERGDNFEFAGAFRDGSTYTGSGRVEMDSRYTMMPSLLIGQYKQFTAADRQDSASTLKVVYNGGGTMDMTGVYTLLTGDSGFEVASGKVSLHGTNTIHAIGSESGTNTNRLQNANDWHYAMAEMQVKVGSGSTFELGDHALLIGDVQVAAGGRFVMKQAVHSRYEFVEGWVLAEDTYALADYYGLKGNVNLAAGASMDITFDEGVATELSYGGNISGDGSLTVSVGEGSVHLTGKNTFSGAKSVESGNLRLAAGAEGDTSTHKWVVGDKASLALDSVSTNAALEARVDASSTGVLALSLDFAEQVSLGGLVVGAAEGETVHYGSASASLQASGSRWTLGGGGGTLLVDFKLDGANKLVLGNEYGTGSVVLTNEANTFSGGIETVGKVTLGYTNAGALGNNVLSIGYGKALAALSGAEFAADKINTSSDGVFATSGGEQHYDLSRHGSLSLGAWGEATYEGTLSVAEGAAYRLGGSGALTIATELSGAHGILIDGQGTTGSSVIFATASADTGAVVVQGYDAGKAAAGDVTLSFTTDNALANASSVSLRNNAVLDLNGTQQSFKGLSGDASSLVLDARGGNTLTINNDAQQTLAARVQAAGTDVVKSGSGTLVLTGEKLWKSLSIQGGTVQVEDGKSLGYLASGSQGIGVNVSNGGMLHLTAATSFTNTLNIEGYGTNGSSVALKADGLLNNTAGTLNIVGDAAISGQFSFKQLNLQGNELTLQGSGSSLAAAGASSGSLKLSSGAKLEFGDRKGWGGVELKLDGGTLIVDNGTYQGSLVVGANGGTIENTWTGSSGEVFSLTGLVSGSSVASTLKLVAFNHTINLSGGADFAGKVEVGNGVTFNVTRDASLGALVREASSGNAATLVVDAATLKLTGKGSNFSNSTLSLTNGATLQLAGLADGSSMGLLDSLNMGTNGELLLSSVAGYGSNAMLHIGSLSGTGKLLFDAAELSSLGAGTYHLLTSGSQLTDYLSLAEGLSVGRRELSLTSTVLADGSHALDLMVGAGVAAAATWKGTGTLLVGSPHDNISSTAADNTFMAMDSLTITSDAGANDTLTLGGDIHASSVSYTGAGSVTLAQENGGKFVTGSPFVLDADGTLNLGASAVFNGTMELRKGTLSSAAEKSHVTLNALERIHVTGDATLVLTSDTAVTTAIKIDGTLRVDSQLSGNGRNLADNLSGAGTLVKLNTGKLNLTGNHAAFTGSIDVQAGTLQLGNGGNNAFALNASSFNVADNAKLEFNSAAIEYGADFTWGKSILYVSEGTGDGPSPTSVGYLFSGKHTLTDALTIQSRWGKVVHINGDIDGTGSLNYSGEGNGGGSPALVLSGSNTYSGGTTLNFAKGTLYAASANAFGTGVIKLQNGTLAWHGVGKDWNGDLTASGIEIEVSGDEDSCVMVNTNGQNVTYSGKVIGSDGSFIKTGAGTLKLSQFTYSGETKIQMGTLELDPYDIFERSNVSGNAGATLRYKTDYYGTVYLMGTTSGEMGLELHGKYAMSSTMGHTGGTELVSGSLEIGNVEALKSGPLYAHEGTTVSIVMAKTSMAGDSVVDALAFGEGASVLVGTENAAGHLSFNSLSGTATPTFLLDIFSADSYDRLSGTLTPGSVLSVNLKASELGSYLLVEGDNSGFDTSAFTYSGSTSSEYLYLWSSSERGITLSIENASIAADANVWTGGSSGTWNASGQGWYGNSFDANKKALFIAPDNSSISVAAAVSTSTLEADVAEGATLSFSAKDGGSISATTLQKEGAGTLSFASGMGNNFSSVVVNEGTLSVSVANGNPLGTTAISGNGTFELTGGSLRADLNAGAMAVTNIRLDGGSLTLYSTADWGTSITGRSIEIVGENSSLALEKWSNLNASSVVLRDGGILRSGENGLGNDGGTISVDGIGVIQYGNTGGGNLAASISGTGTLKVQDWNRGHWVSMNGVISDDKSAAGLLALELSQNYVVMKAVNSYSGGTTISAGTVIAENTSSLGSGALYMTGGTLTLETVFRDVTYSTDLNIGSLSGTGGSIVVGGNTLHINQTGSGTYAGSISGTGAVTKAGTGTLTLSGSNSVAAINLQAGRLVAASDGALGSGTTITLSEGTSLYVANNAKVSAALAGGSYLIGAESGEAGSFTGNAAASLLSSGFTKEGAGKVTVVNSAGTAPAGAMVVNAGILAYDAGSSSTLGAVSGDGTFSLVGGAVNAGNINVGKLVVDKAILAYSSTFDGKALEVSGQGAELRMGHWASVNNSSLLLKDGGQLSMSSSGFSGTTVTVDNGGVIAVGETASKDGDALLDVNSAISGTGTLKLTNYTGNNTIVYTTNLTRLIADGTGGTLALSTDQGNLHLHAANTYSGGTTVNGGKLTAEVTGALGSGAVTINGGELVAKAAGSIGGGDVTMNGGKLTLDLGTEHQFFYVDNLSGEGGIVDAGQHTLVIEQTENGRFDGRFTGSGNLTKRGDATLELGGSVASRNLQIDSGTVKLVDSDVFAVNNMASTSVTMKGGIFDINGQTTGADADSFMFDVDSGFIDFVGDGDMLVKDSSTTAGSGLGFNAASEYAHTVVRHKGTGEAEIAADIVSVGEAGIGKTIGFSVQSTGDLLISGDIGADLSVAEHHQFGISKTGSGTMILSGNNGYTGGTMVTDGTLVLAGNSALGSGYVEIASKATLEIAAGTQVGGLTYGVLFRENSELKLHSLSTDVAALTTTGANIVSSGTNWSGVDGTSMTLTLAADIQLEDLKSYKVLSLGDSVRTDMNAGRVSVNYLGDGRFTFSTRYESSTLYLDVTQDASASLVWGGTAASGTWNQSSQNTNWTTEGSSANESSFMNQDRVSFTDSAANKQVVVDAKGVQVDTMEVSGKGYSFSGGSVQANSASVKESVELDGGASLNMGTVYTVSQKDAAGQAAVIGKVEMSSDFAAGTGSIIGKGGGEISALDHAVIDIAKGMTLTIKDVLLTENSRITDDPATVFMDNVTIALGKANTIIEDVTTLPDGSPLTVTGGGESFDISGGAEILTIYCTALDTVNVTGASLTIDLSGFTEGLTAAQLASDYIAISFGQAVDARSVDNLAHFDAENLTMTATYDGSSFSPVYVKLNEKSNASTLYIKLAANNTSAIPEPTTATLSLLALSFLAARRRRK